MGYVAEDFGVDPVSDCVRSGLYAALTAVVMPLEPRCQVIIFKQTGNILGSLM